MGQTEIPPENPKLKKS